jgi:hypothetical protein
MATSAIAWPGAMRSSAGVRINRVKYQVEGARAVPRPRGRRPEVASAISPFSSLPPPARGGVGVIGGCDRAKNGSFFNRRIAAITSAHRMAGRQRPKECALQRLFPIF